jgi:hypothetical protein
MERSGFLVWKFHLRGLLQVSHKYFGHTVADVEQMRESFVRSTAISTRVSSMILKRRELLIGGLRTECWIIHSIWRLPQASWSGTFIGGISR